VIPNGFLETEQAIFRANKGRLSTPQPFGGSEIRSRRGEQSRLKKTRPARRAAVAGL
jgi:hypothetical protein